MAQEVVSIREYGVLLMTAPNNKIVKIPAIDPALYWLHAPRINVVCDRCKVVVHFRTYYTKHLNTFEEMVDVRSIATVKSKLEDWGEFVCS